MQCCQDYCSQVFSSHCLGSLRHHGGSPQLVSLLYGNYPSNHGDLDRHSNRSNFRYHSNHVKNYAWGFPTQSLPAFQTHAGFRAKCTVFGAGSRTSGAPRHSNFGGSLLV